MDSYASPPKIELMKRLAAIVGVAIAGSQAGHLLTYELRFGAAAQQVQSSGAHAYFPLVVKTLIGAGALALLMSLLVIGFARFATGGKIVRERAPSLLRLVAALYTLQLVFFAVQETVEGSRASELFLWGLLGQLPVAFVAAVALRWLLGALGPALARLRVRYEPVLRLAPYALALFVWPMAADLVQGFEPGRAIDLRGPPSF